MIGALLDIEVIHSISVSRLDDYKKNQDPWPNSWLGFWVLLSLFVFLSNRPNGSSSKCATAPHCTMAFGGTQRKPNESAKEE